MPQQALTSYKSHDGIIIYARPGGTLTVEEQEARFAAIRYDTASKRDPLEAPVGRSVGADRSEDEHLDFEAEGVMRHIFPAHPTAGVRLYLVWAHFRLVRRPGAPAAASVDQVRAELRAELVAVEPLRIRAAKRKADAAAAAAELPPEARAARLTLDSLSLTRAAKNKADAAILVGKNGHRR